MTDQKHTFTPTPEQLQFLEGKLMFLDPNQTGAIATKDAMDFVMHTGVPQQQQQLIWSIANPQNNPQLNHMQMVVAFRLVSYAQNGISVSKNSLMQNIPVRLPMLHDDDDEDDLPPPPRPQHNDFGAFDEVMDKSQGAKATAPIQQRQPQQMASKSPSHRQHADMHQFDLMWARLETFDGMIRGELVKQLYRKTASKPSLAKAWRLCCRTSQGHLTKGQFFGFLHLIKNAQDGKPLPDELTSQAKTVILQIDRNNSAELNRSLNQIQAKMEHLRAGRAVTLNSMREFAANEEKITNWINDLDNMAQSQEAALDNLDKEIDKLYADPTKNNFSTQWQRVSEIHQKHEKIIESLMKGEVPKSPSEAEQMLAMRQKIIEMVRAMKDIDQESARGMRTQLEALNLSDLRNLHTEAVERYEDFKKAEELGRGASYFSSTGS